MDLSVFNLPIQDKCSKQGHILTTLQLGIRPWQTEGRHLNFFIPSPQNIETLE